MKMSSLTFTLCTSVCLGLLVCPAVAKPGKGKGKGKPHKSEHPGNANKANPGKGNKRVTKNIVRWNDQERLKLRNFFAPGNRKNLPPGLRKNLQRGKPLPPGWQKKVAAGQVIDADWLNLMAPVSYEYLPGIQRIPGSRLYYHDNRLIRISGETRVILEVINLLTR